MVSPVVDVGREVDARRRVGVQGPAAAAGGRHADAVHALRSSAIRPRCRAAVVATAAVVDIARVVRAAEADAKDADRTLVVGVEGLQRRKVDTVAIGDLGGSDTEGARDGKEAGEEEGNAHNVCEGETKVGGGSNDVEVPRQRRWEEMRVSDVGRRQCTTASQAGQAK